MKNTLCHFKTSIIALLVLSQLFSQSAWAHARWVLPSHTNLTGNNPHAITLDMSISNDLFSPTHGFIMKSLNKPNGHVTLAELIMITPSGEIVSDLPFVNFDIKSVGKALLDKAGTYHIRLKQDPVYFTTYINKDKTKGKAFGKNNLNRLPEGVTNIKRVKYIPSLDTFVSRNSMTKPHNLHQDLELVSKEHPNDLFVGEKFTFQLVLNGKAITQSTTVDVIKGNTRHRNQRNISKITSDASGWFSVKWQQPGMYLLETEFDVKSDDENVDIDAYSMFTTLEVNPI